MFITATMYVTVTISGSHVFDNMADEGSDASAAVLDLLKSLNDNINELKGESKQVNNRLDALERRRSPSPLSPSASIGLNQEENEQDVDNVYEHSEEEDADEDEFDFTSVLFTKKVGEKISDKLASALDTAMLGVDDFSELTKLQERHVRPENLKTLVVPKINEEIQPSMSIEHKDKQLSLIQKNVVSAISALSRILDDVSKRKNRELAREDIFKKTNDAVSLLTAAYKEVNLARKLNIKPVLSTNIQFLCTRKHALEEDRSSNTFLFDEDLGSEVDKAFKSRRVASRVAKNFRAPARGKFRNARAMRGVNPMSRGLRGRGVSRGMSRRGRIMTPSSRGALQK